LSRFDPAAHREASLQGWEAAAPAWVARQEQIRTWAAPVSQWMVQSADPQPGEQVLELAAGVGETGLLAAELIAPVGRAIISDQAEGMLEGARRRAAELGISNVDFKVLNAEWIDLPLASLDIVLCRWGYMLMADPLAALGESRRVLRPGGRLALAIWDSIQVNPWALLPALELSERHLGAGPTQPAAPPEPGAARQPGPFALGDAEIVAGLLEQAGFTEVTLDTVDLVQHHSDFDAMWESQLDISRTLHDAVMSRPQAEIEEIRTALAARLTDYTLPSGELQLPGRTLVARASA
jgi:SAM-dependent methyltransferase